MTYVELGPRPRLPPEQRWWQKLLGVKQREHKRERRLVEWDVAPDMTLTNANDIVWNPVYETETYEYFRLYDEAEGGKLVASGPLVPPVPVTSGLVVEIPRGQLAITLTPASPWAASSITSWNTL